MSILTNLHAFSSVTRLAKKRSTSKGRPWRLATYAACLLLGLILCSALVAIFGIGDPALRRNTLNLLASLATLGWIISGTVLRMNMSVIFDYRQFLPLPIAFRSLFGFRVLAGLSGLWIPILGPSLVYVLAYRTADLLGFVVVSLAALALVVLLGRLVAVVLLKFDDLAASWLMTATLAAAVVMALFALEPTIQNQLLDVSEESTPALIAKQINDSRLLAATGYLPGGLLVGILNAPQDVGANLARLAILWLVAAACLALEYRTLRRHLLHRISTAAGTGGVHFSLAPVLRRGRCLKPEVCLVLIEFEILMRSSWYRATMIAILFLLAVVQTGSAYILFWAVILVSASFLNVRSQSFGVAHRNIGERLAMPVRLLAPATTYSAAASATPALAFLATICWAWYRAGSLDLATLGLCLALPFCILVGGHGDSVYRSARSPDRFDFTPYAGKLPSSSLLWTSVAFNVAIVGLPFLLALVATTTTWGAGAAVCGAVALVIGAAAFNVRRLRSADRLVRSDPHRLLDGLAGRES